MKAVILAGGYGTRLSEETSIRPKPMVEVGEKPILWHIMKIYSAQGIHDFVICCGYKAYVIKEFFANYAVRTSDVTFDLRNNTIARHNGDVEPWSVTLVDTGDTTMTGGRLRRAREYIGDETFCLTYGDCVADLDIPALVAAHRREDVLVTLTAVQPPGRFGALAFESNENLIERFLEKPRGDGGWVNGGFFVVEPAALDYVEGDDTVWEREPLERLARDGQLAAHKHRGYWQNLDTLRDKMVLEQEWAAGSPRWRIW